MRPKQLARRFNHGMLRITAAFALLAVLPAGALLALVEEPGHDEPVTSQPASRPATAQDPEPRREPSSTEILRKLQEESRREAKGIVRGGVPGTRPEPIEQDPGNAIAPLEGKLLPDGSRLVDRSGRLAKAEDYMTFSFESRGKGAPERPIRLLPNRLLEDMEMYSEGGAKPVVFVISGEVTEYRGVNYLLIQKLLVRPSTGNLK